MRDVLSTLLRRELTTVGDAMAPYYQDVYDHVLRVADWTESLRDLVATTVETNLTARTCPTPAAARTGECGCPPL